MSLKLTFVACLIIYFVLTKVVMRHSVGRNSILLGNFTFFGNLVQLITIGFIFEESIVVVCCCSIISLLLESHPEISNTHRLCITDLGLIFQSQFFRSVCKTCRGYIWDLVRFDGFWRKRPIGITVLFDPLCTRLELPCNSHWIKLVLLTCTVQILSRRDGCEFCKKGNG